MKIIYNRNKNKDIKLKRGDFISFIGVAGKMYIAFVQKTGVDEYMLAIPESGNIWSEKTTKLSLSELQEYVSKKFYNVEVITDKVKLVIE